MDEPFFFFLPANVRVARQERERRGALNLIERVFDIRDISSKS